MTLLERVLALYQRYGIPTDRSAEEMVLQAESIGLEEEQVLQNAAVHCEKRQRALLVPGAEAKILRSSGDWTPVKIVRVEPDGYVVEWEVDGSWSHKTVSFDNAKRGHIQATGPIESPSAAQPAAPPPPQAQQPASTDTSPAPANPSPAAPPPPQPAAEPPSAPPSAAPAAPPAPTASAAAPPPPPAPAASEAPADPPAPAAAVAPPPPPAPTPTVSTSAKEGAPAAGPKPAIQAPSKKKGGALELVVDGVGDGMVNEMQPVLDDSKVQFALVQIPLGSGTFQRNKMIFLQWAGSSCPPMRKAKQVQRTGEVSAILGSTHASLNITSRDECTIEHILTELKHVFVSDDGQFSIAGLKDEIAKRVEQAKKMESERRKKLQASSPTIAAAPAARPTASDMGLNVDAVMKELRKPLGAFNWVLFNAQTNPLSLFNAGSESVEEMHGHLPDDKVLYGLLRLGFGKGTFRRTKWVCFTYVGGKVGAVSRGKAVGVKGEMEAKLKPFQVTVDLQGKEEATVEGVLDRVRPFVVSDDIEMMVTVENYKESLAEEKAAQAEFFGEDPAAVAAAAAAEGAASEVPEEPVHHDTAETVKNVHAEGAPLWAVFSIAE